MKYAYEDLSPEQFEDLVILICERLLGVGTQGFATGRDGGRDARFEGTAELHPSTSAPWRGKVIIQAKHTNGHNKQFGEGDFFKNESKTNTIALEVPRIRALKAAGELDHYLLFANRKLTGGVEAKLRNYLQESCGIDSGSVHICGVEALERYMKRFPQIPDEANLDPFDFPLLVGPDEIAIVVEALAGQSDAVSTAVRQAPVERTAYSQKNQLNNMSEEYAKTLRRRYLAESSVIRDFLADPVNEEITAMYEVAVEEFQLEIIAKRQDHQTFDRVMNYLFQLLVNRDPTLKSNKRLTRIVLFYMYWNCDIGVGDDADTVETYTS